MIQNFDDKLSAIIALLAALVEKREGIDVQRVELILNSAGLAPSKIAKLLGKKPDTVIKTINRGKKQL